jgi:hypothetical protein
LIPPRFGGWFGKSARLLSSYKVCAKRSPAVWLEV